jgi:hypothetical protein
LARLRFNGEEMSALPMIQNIYGWLHAAAQTFSCRERARSQSSGVH